MQHHHQHEHYHQQHQKKHNITTPQQTPKGERERGKSVALIHNKTNQNKKQQNEEKKKRMPERARARLGRLGRKRNKFFWIFFVFVCCGGVEEKEKMNHKRMQPLNLTIGSKVGALKLFEDKDSHHPRSALVAVGTRFVLKVVCCVVCLFWYCWEVIPIDISLVDGTLVVVVCFFFCFSLPLPPHLFSLEKKR